MQTNISLKFKIAKIVIGVAALAPLMGFALAAQADTTAAGSSAASASSSQATTVSADATAQQVSAFCATVDASTTTLDSLISAKEASYENGKMASDKALAASRAASDKALYDARVAANADYAAQFKTLAAQATTPDQQAAVALFKKTVLQAVATRRANVDLAVQNYRDGVDAILAARSSTYTSALAALKATIDQTLSAIASNCATAGSTPTDPKGAIASAQSSFQTTISNLTDSTDALTALANTRDTKVAAFDAKFSGTITSAAAALNAALGTQ